ncbi:hypothetical protein MTO96_024410 [Rhipicephalus appendiculatus]
MAEASVPLDTEPFCEYEYQKQQLPPRKKNLKVSMSHQQQLRSLSSDQSCNVRVVNAPLDLSSTFVTDVRRLQIVLNQNHLLLCFLPGTHCLRPQRKIFFEYGPHFEMPDDIALRSCL